MSTRVSITETEIPDVLLVETAVFRDDRGFFTETYSKATWAEHGFTETFLQDSMSLSAKGTLRGMHYQLEPHAMGKLVRTVSGAIFDVAVDLRKGSPTFGQWVGRELSDKNCLCMWVPAGFAHGFIALEENTLVYYKSTAVYTPQSERSLSYQCPRVGIEWPVEPASVSAKDAVAPNLDAAEYNFDY